MNPKLVVLATASQATLCIMIKTDAEQKKGTG